MADEFFADISNGANPPKYRYFDGESWKESTSGRFTQIVSPVTNELYAEVPIVTHEEIDAVMTASENAQKAWEAVPMHDRVKIVHLAADWCRHYADYLAAILVNEVGKSAGEAKSEVIRTADLVDYFADEVQSIRGEEMDSDNFPGFDKGRIALIDRVAHGVSVAIPPFNYPINLTASKLAPALLMGNSVVLKPPTMGGISALHLVRIFEKAGVPKGVLTAVTGGGSEIGDHLVSHPKVRMVTFTGSNAVGRSIAQKVGMKPMVFECGGNNPAVVMPDADMKTVAKEILKGAFSYSGQRCTGIKYVLATESIINEVIDKVKEMMPEMVKMGDPRSPETKMVGPVVSEKEAEKIEGEIKRLVENGAEVILGGKRDKAYIEPTLLKNSKPELVVDTEIFGPVVSFITVKDYDEALRIINSSNYGLQACVFTKDEGTGLVFAKRVDVGTVQINGSPQRGPDHFPFMGVKHSGVGVQGVRYSLEWMSRLRSVVINKPQ